jgi:peptidyl-prolyl cis-trans isomerase SurA
MKFSRFILLLAAAVVAPFFSRAEVADGVKAVVADRVVTFAEVEDITRPAAEALRRQYASDPTTFNQKLNEALQDSLEILVEHALILHSFETDGYKVPESYLEQIVQDRIRERFGDRVTLMKSLQQQGLTFEQWKKQVREQWIESAMRSQKIQHEITLSPNRIQNYYEQHADDFKIDDQVKLRMIVLNKTTEHDTNALALADEIESKLREGVPFNELASVYSQGSQQHQAGDWGWVEKSVLRKELSEVAFSLDKGKYSQPIDASDAVYVMLVEDKKTSSVKPLADVHDEIEKNLRTQQQAQLEKQWIDGLKKKTFIRYFE